MVERAANPKGKRPGFWPRAAFVSVAALGTIITAGLFGYYDALELWYYNPNSGYFNINLAAHYNKLAH
jgi:hypothetical protein